jgi:molybdate transport system substrate-binding protein
MVCRVPLGPTRGFLVLLPLMLSSAVWSTPAPAQDQKLIVFAAASLKDALDEVNVAYQTEEGRQTATSYAATSTLALVSRGEAPLGIVYQTDAVADKGLKIPGTFPENAHPPVIHPVAAVAISTNPGTPRYIAFLRSSAARPIFEKHGFTFLQ